MAMARRDSLYIWELDDHLPRVIGAWILTLREGIKREEC
jgi:hypothetical protein